MKKKLLLTGASGFLGWNICSAAKNDWEIFGIVHSKKPDIAGVKIIQADLTQEKSVHKLFQSIQPDAVIHTAAISDANYCQDHPEESYETNVRASLLLAEESANRNTPFAFTSSDLVFDGEKGNYTETDAVNPVSKYGEQKVMAEQGILKIYPEAAICRMPLMVGNCGPIAHNYLKNILQKLKKNEPLTLFTDEFRSPLGGGSAAKSILLALENFQGIFHLGGEERLSRYELGSMTVKCFGFPESLLISVKQEDIKMAAPRPRDVSLNSQKAKKKGFKPLTVFEELTAIAKQ